MRDVSEVALIEALMLVINSEAFFGVCLISKHTLFLLGGIAK